MNDLIQIFAKIIGIYSLLLIITGSIGNFFAFLLCLHKNLRQIPTFIFTAFALIADIVSLYFWNIDHYLYGFENYQMEELSLELCRFATFFQTLTLQCSAWFLVFMSSDRYLSIIMKKWRTFLNAKVAVLICIGVTCVAFVINLTLAMIINYDTPSTNITCFVSDFFPQHMKGNIVLYGFLPYSFMFVSNVLLASKLLSKDDNVRVNRSEESNSKRKSISVTVLIITTVFVVVTLPINIINAFLVELLVFEDYGFVLIFFFDCLAFTYHGCHYAILIATNKVFRKEAKIYWNMIKNFGNNRVLASNSTDSTLSYPHTTILRHNTTVHDRKVQL